MPVAGLLVLYIREDFLLQMLLLGAEISYKVILHKAFFALSGEL